MWRLLARKVHRLAARVGDLALALVSVLSGRQPPTSEAFPAEPQPAAGDPFRSYLGGRPSPAPPAPHDVVGRVRQLMDRAERRRSAQERRIEEAARRLGAICELIENGPPAGDETPPYLPQAYGDELYGIWREIELWRAQGRFSAFVRLGGRRHEAFDHDAVIAVLGLRAAAEVQACLDGESDGLASGPYRRLERALTVRRWLRPTFGRRPGAVSEEEGPDDLLQA